MTDEDEAAARRIGISLCAVQPEALFRLAQLLPPSITSTHSASYARPGICVRPTVRRK